MISFDNALVNLLPPLGREVHVSALELFVVALGGSGGSLR